MTKSKDYNFFLSIRNNDIKFEAIDKDNQIFFSKNKRRLYIIMKVGIRVIKNITNMERNMELGVIGMRTDRRSGKKNTRMES